MKNFHRTLTVLFFSFFVFLFTDLFVIPVFAKNLDQENRDKNSQSSKWKSIISGVEHVFRKKVAIEQEESKESTQSENVRNRNEIRKEIRLEGDKINSCLARQKAIVKRLESLNKLVINMVEVFDGIAQKAQDFYAVRVDAGGTKISNYDDLVTDIVSKKDIVNADLTKAQDDMKSFTCTGEDPKGHLSLFRTDMQAVKEDLHNYRTSIKNLIIAIKPDVESADAQDDQSSESTNSNDDAE